LQHRTNIVELAACSRRSINHNKTSAKTIARAVLRQLFLLRSRRRLRAVIKLFHRRWLPHRDVCVYVPYFFLLSANAADAKSWHKRRIMYFTGSNFSGETRNVYKIWHYIKFWYACFDDAREEMRNLIKSIILKIWTYICFKRTTLKTHVIFYYKC